MPTFPSSPFLRSAHRCSLRPMRPAQRSSKPAAHASPSLRPSAQLAAVPVAEAGGRPAVDVDCVSLPDAPATVDVHQMTQSSSVAAAAVAAKARIQDAFARAGSLLAPASPPPQRRTLLPFCLLP